MENIVPAFSGLLLIIVRVSAFFITMPIFSHKSLPARFRIGISVLLAWLIYYSVDSPQFEINGDYFMLIMKEAIVGLAIGFIAYMIMTAINAMGGFVDLQMGFAMANVYDPQTGVSSPLTGQYFYMIAILFLLATNGHHLLLDGIFYSYQFIPLEQVFIPFGNENLLVYIAKAFSQMFLIALQMAIPIVGSLFIVDVALGMLARTMPQLNVFVVGFPIKIAIGFIVMIILIGVTLTVIADLFEYALVTMRGVMELMGGAK